MKEMISKYLAINSRNKVIIYRKEILDLFTLDIGQSLSHIIYQYEKHEFSPTRVAEDLEKLCFGAIKFHEHYGDYLSIKNLGVLFEPELKINFLLLLEKLSQNNALFIEWEGDIEDSHLYFLSKENGIKTNIKNLSHIII